MTTPSDFPDYGDLPDIAISIMQPWAWLIVHGHKSVENRSWATKFRGRVAIHAGKTVDRDAMADVGRGQHPVTGEDTLHGLLPFVPLLRMLRGDDRGGIVGVADIVDCVDRSSDEFFVGPYGFVLANARPLPFIPVKGALGFFKWKDRLL